MGVSGIKGRPRGRPFAKGRSGNPGGRPIKPKTIEQRKLEADVRMLAFVHAEKLSFKKTVGGPRPRFLQALLTPEFPDKPSGPA